MPSTPSLAELLSMAELLGALLDLPRSLEDPPPDLETGRRRQAGRIRDQGDEMKEKKKETIRT